MKFLVHTPLLSLMGGVSNHWRGLKEFLFPDFYFVTTGSRRNLSGFFYLPFDLILALIKVYKFKINCVILNPSFQAKSFYRDLVFIFFYYLLGIKYIVFFHGWESQFEKSSYVKDLLLLFALNNSRGCIVLSLKFKDYLYRLGVKRKIYVSTTKVNDNFLENFDITNKSYNPIVFSFVSRVEINKGVFEAIEIFRNCKTIFPNSIMYIVGEGNALNSVREFVIDNNFSDIKVMGRLNGQNLADIYSLSNFFLFPSSHGEGLPTSILEALSFGNIVLTTDKGGIIENLDQNVVYFNLSISKDFERLSTFLSVYKNSDLLKEGSYRNYSFSKNRFLASKVSINLKNILYDALT